MFKERYMGKVVKKNHEIVFQQDNGEITAWLTDFKEKTELSHAGTSFYKKIFYACVVTGVLYLGYIFLFL